MLSFYMETHFRYWCAVIKFSDAVWQGNTCIQSAILYIRLWTRVAKVEMRPTTFVCMQTSQITVGDLFVISLFDLLVSGIDLESAVMFMRNYLSRSVASMFKEKQECFIMVLPRDIWDEVDWKDELHLMEIMVTLSWTVFQFGIQFIFGSELKGKSRLTEIRNLLFSIKKKIKWHFIKKLIVKIH